MDPGRFALTHLAVLVRYQDDWRDDRMSATFALARLVQYRRDGTVLLKIPGLVKKSQLFTSLRANDSGGAGPRGVRSGKKEMLDTILVKEANEEYRGLDG